MQVEEKSHQIKSQTREEAMGKDYLELTNFLPDGYIVTDSNLTILESNSGAEILLGIQREGLIGTPLHKFIPEDEKPFFLGQVSLIKSESIDRLTDWEVIFCKDDGSLLHSKISLAIRRGGQDEHLSLLWLLRDNTGQVRADKALWESEKRFRSVTESASDAIIIFNNRLHLVYWNEKAKDMFSYPSGETMYKLLGTIVTGGFEDKLEREILHILSTGHSDMIGKSWEAMGIRRNGQEFPIELSLATWQASDEIYFTIIVRDISERKQTEQKLLISEKMASLGRLTAGIAHEINTPIAAVRAALVEASALVDECQMAIGDSTVTNDDWKEILQELENAVSLAERSASRAASFVKGIRSQTRNPEIHDDRTFDANIVISDSVLMLNHLFRKANCSFNFVASEEGALLFGSPERFSRIVLNLLVNAIDASATKGGGPISLSLAPVENEIVMKVTDQGIGIEPDHMPKLYDPMFSTKPFGEGSGLGLTIVHHNITAHFDGKIEVESKPGKGTEFRVYFPIRDGT